MESDYYGVGCGSQQDIRFGNLTHGLVYYIHLNLVFGEFYQRVRHGLYRTVHVAFDDDVQLLEVAYGDTASDFIQRDVLLGAQSLHALQLFALAGNGSCAAVVLHDIEVVARLRCAVQTQYEYGGRGRGLRDFLSAFVEHGLYPAGVNPR